MLEQTNKQNYKFERSYMSIFMTKSKNLSGSYHISLMPKVRMLKFILFRKKTSLNLCKREIFFPNQYLYCNVVSSCSWLVAWEQQNAEGSLKLSAFMMPYSLYKNIVFVDVWATIENYISKTCHVLVPSLRKKEIEILNTAV